MNPMTAALEQAKKVKGEIAVGAAIVKTTKSSRLRLIVKKPQMTLRRTRKS